MSTMQIVRVGTAAAQAAVDMAAQATGDPGAGALRVGLLEFLRVHARELTADPGTAELLDAYGSWLETAVALYQGDNTQIREYMRRGALLGAELDLLTSGALTPPTAGE